MTRATLDSNLYISALHFGGIATRILTLARAGKIRIDCSDVILAETIGVLRDKFHWEPYRLHFAALELRKLANLVNPAVTLNVTADPDDNRIIECAVTASSDVVVTYDSDLLRLVKFGGIRIVQPADFLLEVSEQLGSAEE